MIATAIIEWMPFATSEINGLEKLDAVSSKMLIKTRTFIDDNDNTMTHLPRFSLRKMIIVSKRIQLEEFLDDGIMRPSVNNHSVTQLASSRTGSLSLS